MSDARRARLPLLALIAASIAIIVGAGVAVAPRPAPAWVGTAYDPAPAGDFALRDHEGRPATLASFRGHPVLLFFGYTRCPDICPLTLQKLTAALRAQGRAGSDVRIVLITTDPANDTPAVLKAYAAPFGPQVVGLTGDSAAVAASRTAYGAYILPTRTAPATGEHAGHAMHAPAGKPGVMAHSGAVYGIDSQGNLRVVISEMATADEARHDIALLARM
ncbi:MAG TPA: SCO family protein [Longimicrobium sp.]|jgi:protein SCO1/2|uniref:SCO family protein n=1 Tax=Longimicrobium sp. TaxID=2029185 RepID=UPI002ED9C517